MKIIKFKIKNLLLIFLILSNCVYANYITNEKIILKAGNNIILKSQVNKYINIMNIISYPDSNIDKKEIFNKVFNNIIMIDNYADILDNLNISIENELITTLFKNVINEEKISIIKFKKFIKKAYEIKSINLDFFIINNVAVNKLKKIICLENLSISWNDIKNFFNSSNYLDKNKVFFNYEIIQIAIYKKSNIKLNNLKKIIKFLNEEEKIEEIKKKLKSKNITVREIIISPSNTKYISYKDYLKNDKFNNVLRPIYQGNFIFLVKVIKRINKIDYHKPFIKITSNTIKIKKLEKNKKTYNYIKLTDSLYKKNYINTLNNNKTLWIYNDNIEKEIFNNIKNLKINEISKIIETESGWHIIKILDKNIDQRSNLYSYIEENIALDKINEFSKDLTKKIIDKSVPVFYK